MQSLGGREANGLGHAENVHARGRERQIRLRTVGYEVHPSGAPDPDFLNMPGVGIGYIVDFYTPLLPPPGAADRVRVEYAPGRHLWVQPRADTSERQPGVVFIHGGGWANGTPAWHFRHVQELAAEGYVGAAIQYRLTSEAPWPAQLDDVRAALDWLRVHADELGLDPTRIVASGGSAGGHLAAMAALTGEAQAGVLWYPATDLRSITKTAPGLAESLVPGADDDAFLAASPIGHVHPGAPPILTLTSDLDTLTTLEAIEAFHHALDAAGVHNELVVFKDRVHGFDFHPIDWAACFERVCTFLASIFKEPHRDDR